MADITTKVLTLDGASESWNQRKSYELLFIQHPSLGENKNLHFLNATLIPQGFYRRFILSGDGTPSSGGILTFKMCNLQAL